MSALTNISGAVLFELKRTFDPSRAHCSLREMETVELAKLEASIRIELERRKENALRLGDR